MKVICKENRAHKLSYEENEFTFSKETKFIAVLGKEYIVMGIMMRKDSNALYYLIDEYHSPYWIPYIVFDIFDNQIFTDWHIAILEKAKSTGTIFYISGFKELCNDDDYHDALMEREPWALDIYFKRKREMQEWYELKPFMSKE
jgi:hypothetical protein